MRSPLTPPVALSVETVRAWRNTVMALAALADTVDDVKAARIFRIQQDLEHIVAGDELPGSFNNALGEAPHG